MAGKTYNERLEHIKHFYELMSQLENCIGGKRELANCESIRHPRFGVYFFFEPGEMRLDSGKGLRVVRVGTHALTSEGKNTLWSRLSSHRGTLAGKNPGGGNHRGSVFRLHVGKALIDRDNLTGPGIDTWGNGNHASASIRDDEGPLEKKVSEHIRRMPFIYLRVQDIPQAPNIRGVIEKNCIALLSNYLYPDCPIDPPSDNWLGHHSPNLSIARSGLWNVNHVNEDYDPAFLERLRSLIKLQCSNNMYSID
jgi:hypothetical protein